MGKNFQKQMLLIKRKLDQTVVATSLNLKQERCGVSQWSQGQIRRKLVVAMNGSVKGRKLKMKMTENDHDQMTGILHCKSGKDCGRESR